jgi:hypothetical protein
VSARWKRDDDERRRIRKHDFERPEQANNVTAANAFVEGRTTLGFVV